MEYKRIFIPVIILVRANSEICPGRAHRQLIMEADAQCGAEVIEILVEGIGQDIGTAVIWGLALLFAAAAETR